MIRQYDPIVYERMKRDKEYDSESLLFNFLHEKGYTAFSIPRLTIPEVALLCHAAKLQEYEMKKKQRK